MKLKSDASSSRICRSQTGLRMLVLQGLILSVAAFTFALLPPDKGPILLLSLNGHGATGLIGPDLKLLGAGRLPGSLVVTGAHPSFMDALAGHAVLILPAVPLLCGPVTGLES